MHASITNHVRWSEIKFMFFWLQVSVGTLLAFTIVAVSILILRYVPPDEVPLPPSMQESFHLNQECDEERDRGLLGVGNCNLSQTKDVIVVVESVKDPLIDKRLHKGNTNLLSSFIQFHCSTTDTTSVLEYLSPTSSFLN
jgi:hypothetical protein